MSDASLADVIRPADRVASASPRSLPSADHIHLWYLDRSQIPLHESWLAGDERERTEKMTAERREEFVSGRNALRIILGYMLERDPASIAIRLSDKGKPCLDDQSIDFSFSHCHRKLLMGFASQPLGIDLAFVRPRENLMGMARRIFDRTCCEQLQSATGLERERLFYRFWSAHEAIQKVRGDGLFGERHVPRFVGNLEFPGFQAAIATEIGTPVFVIHEMLPQT